MGGENGKNKKEIVIFRKIIKSGGKQKQLVEKNEINKKVVVI